MKSIYILLTLLLLCANCYSQEWYVYNDPGNACKIEFPDEPSVINIPAGFGLDSTKVVQYLPHENFENAIVASLTIMYMSEEILDPSLDETKRFEVLKKYSVISIKMIGEVVESENISLSGFPGIFIKGRITQAVNDENYPPLYIKSYLIGNTVYILQVACSTELLNSDSIDFFFNSFQLNISITD